MISDSTASSVNDLNSPFEITEESLKENTNSLDEIMNMRGGTFISKEATVISSTDDSLESMKEKANNDEVDLETNPYICKEMNVITSLPFESSYNPFEENSLERCIDEQNNSLNCQEVNVISCLNMPFETQVELNGKDKNVCIEEKSLFCKETSLTTDTTKQPESFKNIHIATGNANGNSHAENSLTCKETNVITGLNQNAPNRFLGSDSSDVRELLNAEQHCMETNVITVLHKQKNIVPPTVKKSFKLMSKEDTIGANHSNEACIIEDITKNYDGTNEVNHSLADGKTTDYDFDAIKNNSFSCKETNVITCVLSSLESPNSYIEDDTFDKDMMEKVESEAYPCRETNVIIGLNPPTCSATTNSSIKYDSKRNSETNKVTNVKSSVFSMFESVGASTLNAKSQGCRDFNEIPLVCKETYVITSPPSASVITDAPPYSSSICRETNVITNANLPFETRNDTFKNTVTLQEDFNVEENRNMCQETKVGAGVNVPFQSNSVSRKDNMIGDKPFDIIDYTSYNCKQRNFSTDKIISQKDTTFPNKELIEMKENPYLCQVTNVITSVSLPMQTTNSPLRSHCISDGDNNCAEGRCFNTMTSNFINGINSPFEDSNSFETAPSFESIEEELVPYENLQNQPVFLVLDQTKDLESINFNALCQGLFSSIPTMSTKTQVIVNNNLFNENLFISPNILLEEADEMETNVSDGCVTLSDVEVEFTDINWCENYQLPSLTSKLGTLPVNSLPTVIKNVSGGEVKDVGPPEPPSNQMSSLDKELMGCGHLRGET